ncbi:Rdx family-domain-containing protein [Aspergillus aurantiobrunneus]
MQVRNRNTYTDATPRVSLCISSREHNKLPCTCKVVYSINLVSPPPTQVPTPTFPTSLIAILNITEPTATIEQNPPTTPTQPAGMSQSQPQSYSQPRITIQYCTQCKWMLRAAYFAQELLSTFSTAIGEVALVPRTGGIFTVTILPSAPATPTGAGEEGVVLWDRKADGGFPEVKELKSRVRNVIDPSRDLGHTDRALRKGEATASGPVSASTSTSASTSAVPSKPAEPGAEACEDCK